MLRWFSLGPTVKPRFASDGRPGTPLDGNCSAYCEKDLAAGMGRSVLEEERNNKNSNVSRPTANTALCRNLRIVLYQRSDLNAKQMAMKEREVPREGEGRKQH